MCNVKSNIWENSSSSRWILVLGSFEPFSRMLLFTCTGKIYTSIDWRAKRSAISVPRTNTKFSKVFCFFLHLFAVRRYGSFFIIFVIVEWLISFWIFLSAAFYVECFIFVVCMSEQIICNWVTLICLSGNSFITLLFFRVCFASTLRNLFRNNSVLSHFGPKFLKRVNENTTLCSTSVSSITDVNQK